MRYGFQGKIVRYSHVIHMFFAFFSSVLDTAHASKETDTTS